MSLQNGSFENTQASTRSADTASSSEACVYIADLLGELQVIAKMGGLSELAADIETLVAVHIEKNTDSQNYRIVD